MTDKIVPVRCYACGHVYGAVLDRLDTTCPQCGSDSLTRERKPNPTTDELLETGRRLASRRDDLIATGVDPNELEVPIAPPSSGPIQVEDSLPAKLARLADQAGLAPTMGPINGVVFHEASRPPTRPPEHHHRWAWAQLVAGGERQVCYDCGTPRR